MNDFGPGFTPMGGRDSEARDVGASLELERMNTVNADNDAIVLAGRPELHLIGVVPMHPDETGLAGAAQSFGRPRSASSHPLVWVGAPPGAGKLLWCELPRERRLDSFWYQVDSGDGDPATFSTTWALLQPR